MIKIGTVNGDVIEAGGVKNVTNNYYTEAPANEHADTHLSKDAIPQQLQTEEAELTGMQHKNIMQAIRNMEPAWEKVQGLKFQLSSRTYQLPNGGTKEVPCYVLSKTECLYIATKFNDEARAKLVIRWEQLEMEALRQAQGPVRCLPSPQKILAMADEIIGEGLRMLNELAEDTLTATQVAKTFRSCDVVINCHCH